MIRSAKPEDLEDIQGLLELLRLPVDGVGEHLGHFLVLDLEGRVVGTVGLEVYGHRALLRSLGVTKEQQCMGWGGQLYEAVLARARALGVTEIVLLTETAAGFFGPRGFEPISRDEVDDEVKESVEFRKACPTSATCMRLRLA